MSLCKYLCIECLNSTQIRFILEHTHTHTHTHWTHTHRLILLFVFAARPASSHRYFSLMQLVVCCSIDD